MNEEYGMAAPLDVVPQIFHRPPTRDATAGKAKTQGTQSFARVASISVGFAAFTLGEQ